MKKETERNLKRFRRWLCENAVARVVNGFLPTFLDDHSKKIKVVIDDSMQPCTDGETIHVSLIPQFLEDNYSEEEWMIALKAATAHEAQHINSSNFSDVMEIQEWYGSYLADNYELDKTIGKSIASNALNIVEDGRIERIAILRRPGMYCPFRFFNDAIREGTTVTGKSDTPAGEYEDFWGAILSYAKTGLYSPGIEVYAKTRLESVALGVQSLIDDGVASNSSDECRALVQELLEDVAPYIVDLIKADPDLEASLKEQDIKPEYTSNMGEEAQGNAASGGSPLRAPTSSNKPAQSSESAPSEEKGQGRGGSAGGQEASEKPKEESGEDENSQSDERNKNDSKFDPQKTGFSKSDKYLDPLSENEMEEIKRQIGRELTAANQEERAAKDQTDSDCLSKSDIESIRANYTGQTLPVKYTTIPIIRCNELPPELKSQAASLRREITRIQEARNKSHKGLRKGVLDTGALWKTGLREDTVFSRKGNPNAGSVVFYLTLDNSGSMNSPCSRDQSSLKKYQAARSAAAVIEEASKGIISCKIALFDQSAGNVNHNVIKEFDERKDSNCSWNSLSVIGTGGGNMDSVNIRISATELTRRPERKKVLMLLSDGTPSAYGSRSEALAEVRQSVLDARRKGIIVIPIMFGDEEFLNTSQKAYELMYEKNIVACEPMEITNRLCAIFRQVICR